VRQLEIGLSSVAGLLLGVTFSLYGIALLLDGRVAKWIRAVVIVGGVPTAMAGVVIAYTGSSNLALTINMFSNLLLILWMLVVGVSAWRRPLFSSANGPTVTTERSTSEAQSR
jgi:hypothetical protein